MSRLVLIDGHAILHRAYHAYPPLMTSKGELISAVYGFTSILLTVLKQLKPKYVVVAFDLPKPTFRHKEFEAYKAHRPKVDEELTKQIPRTHQVVEILNIPIFEVEGYEADDVIGTLAKRAQVDEVIIVTGDRDAFQLIDNKIKVFVPGRGRKPALMFDRKAFLEKYSFEPRRLVDFKSLAGDASDGIPGVKGIGPKTATKLITQFGGLKEIYDNLDKIDKKTITKLKDEEEQALLSYKLAEIVADVPIDFKLKDCRLTDYDKQKAVAIFKKLEFKSLINKLPNDNWEEEVEEILVHKKAKKKGQQTSLF